VISGGAKGRRKKPTRLEVRGAGIGRKGNL
jgi:hypothetical protein